MLALGWKRPEWVAGAVGFAALVVVAPFLVRLPGRGLTAAVILAVVTDRVRRRHPQGRAPPRRTARVPAAGPERPACAAPGRALRGAGHDRRRVPAVPLQRGHGRPGRGDLHERPGGAALLGRLAGRRVRPAAERGVRRLPGRAAGARRQRVRGHGRQPRRRLQRPLGGDSGTDRARGALAPGRAGAVGAAALRRASPGCPTSARRSWPSRASRRP